jgi:hypothetical protein
MASFHVETNILLDVFFITRFFFLFNYLINYSSYWGVFKVHNIEASHITLEGLFESYTQVFMVSTLGKGQKSAIFHFFKVVKFKVWRVWDTDGVENTQLIHDVLSVLSRDEGAALRGDNQILNL